MIDVVIIEDEKVSSKYLIDLLKMYDAHLFKVKAVLESIIEATEWFIKNGEPDLIFMDVKLSDGDSFEILKRVKITCPIIYTTAYNDFAIKAIKNNGFDYLLKPIDSDDFYNALNDFLKNRKPVGTKETETPYLLVKLGQKYIPINFSETAFFFKDELVFVMLKDKRTYPINKSLSEVEKILPSNFFRANRQIIINLDCIDHLYQYKPGQLIIKMKPMFEKPIILSQEKSSLIKSKLGY